MRSLITKSLFALTLVIVSSSSLFAQANKLTINDVFNLELVSDPQISPDGKQIIYVRQFADIMTDRRCSNLWIINFDGSDNRPLTTGNFNDANPRWSPDGKQILYVSTRDGSPQIYRRWMDSGQTAKLTNLTQAPAGVSWSPDGKWLSFTMLVPEAAASIIKMPAPPEGAKWAEPAKVIDKLVYRFNGAGYLKPGYTHLFVLPAEGGTPRQLSNGKFQHGGLAFRSSDAVWTPDSKALLISANRNDDWELNPINTEIYEFAVADGAVKALTMRKGPDGAPEVSPDGKWIAYTGFDDRLHAYEVTKLYVMNRDGSNPRLITGNFDRDIGGVSWAADGSGIYFTTADQGNTGLYFTTLDGKVKKLTGNLGSGTNAGGGAPSFTIAKNGAFATTYSRPNVPGDVAVGLLSKGELNVLTSVNADVFAGKQLGTVEEIWYESSKDKRKIQGWIIKPPNFDATKKYPLILEIHGGPHANYGDRFDLEKQMMAASGYVVLYTNPRGSTSYGKEFGNLIDKAYPGDDFFDLFLRVHIKSFTRSPA